MKLHATLEAVTQRIRQRSQQTRSHYLARLALAADRKPGSEQLGCATEWAAREAASMPEGLRAANAIGMGRELFAAMRRNALTAEAGACSWL